MPQIESAFLVRREVCQHGGLDAGKHNKIVNTYKLLWVKNNITYRDFCMFSYT